MYFTPSLLGFLVAQSECSFYSRVHQNTIPSLPFRFYIVGQSKDEELGFYSLGIEEDVVAREAAKNSPHHGPRIVHGYRVTKSLELRNSTRHQIGFSEARKRKEVDCFRRAGMTSVCIIYHFQALERADHHIVGMKSWMLGARQPGRFVKCSHIPSSKRFSLYRSAKQYILRTQ